MAETVNSVSDSEGRSESGPVARPMARPRNRGVYGGRFAVAYILLLVVFGAVVALFTYLAARPEPGRWGNFVPQGEGLARARVIANKVAENYHLEGQQMAVVNAQPPIVENVPIDAIAIPRNTSQGIGGGYLSIEPAASTLFYVFCGRGNGCSMPGAANLQRGRLLRRQSLELALYTFKYMKDIDSVVTLLPPPAGAAEGQRSPAVYLRRRFLADALDQPLSKTLNGAPPYTIGNLPSMETVERLTVGRWFPYSFQQLPNGRALLQLGGPPPQQEAPAQQGTPQGTP
jgi:hypothetical protein